MYQDIAKHLTDFIQDILCLNGLQQVTPYQTLAYWLNIRLRSRSQQRL